VIPAPHLDLAVTNAGAAGHINNASILLGKIDDTFMSAVSYTINSPPTSLGIADFPQNKKRRPIRVS
jgi:hypothetical protein